MSAAPDGTTVTLPLSASDSELRLPPRVRERWLSRQVDDAVVQAAGEALHIWVWSDRHDVRLRLPMTRFVVGRPYTRSLHRWGVNVNKWSDDLATQPGDDCCYQVEATLTTIDHDYPPTEML